MEMYKFFREVNEKKSNMLNFLSGFIDLLEDFEIHKLSVDEVKELVVNMNSVIEAITKEITREEKN